MKKALSILAVALPLSLIVLSLTVPVNHSSAFVPQPTVTIVADGGTPLPPPIPPKKGMHQPLNATLVADGGTPLPPPPPPKNGARPTNNRLNTVA
jgi:hypothetical protein